MKTLLLVCLLAVSSAVAEDIKLTNGSALKDITISRIEPDGIVIIDASGVRKLSKSEIEATTWANFGTRVVEVKPARTIASVGGRWNSEAAAEWLRANRERAARAQKLSATGAVWVEAKIHQIVPDGVLAAIEIDVAEAFVDPATNRQDLTVTVKRMKNVFISGVGKGLADGDTWEGALKENGTMQYTAATGSVSTVHAYKLAEK